MKEGKESQNNDKKQIFSPSENNNNKNPIIQTRTKKTKELKIKAYCSDCFQFFHNSPFSKVCIKHAEKKCDIISCKKNNIQGCVRKFSNKNSANRHTYCLTKDDIINLDKNLDIKHCLGKKRMKEKTKDIDESNLNSYDNVHQLIEQIDHVNFFRDEPELFNLNFNDDNQQKFCNFGFGLDNNKNNNNFNYNFISNEDKIETFFEEVQRNSNIPNTVKKKLIKAFKKKGIHNVRVLKLFKEKNKGWEFLIDEFKNVTSQIEGITLCIEYLLK